MLIQEDIIGKLDSGILTPSDLNEYYEIYTKIANESEYIQDFCRDWNFIVFFNTESEADHWIKIDGSHFSYGMGQTNNPDVVYKITTNEFLQILSWNNDYIFTLFNSRLIIEGNISDSDKFMWFDSKNRGKM